MCRSLSHSHILFLSLTLFLSLSLSLSFSLSRSLSLTHTHTHTLSLSQIILIYVFVFVCLCSLSFCLSMFICRFLSVCMLFFLSSPHPTWSTTASFSSLLANFHILASLAIANFTCAAMKKFCLLLSCSVFHHEKGSDFVYWRAPLPGFDHFSTFLQATYNSVIRLFVVAYVMCFYFA